MKNMYRLPWQASKTVPAYDKTTPGEVAEGTEFHERVRLSRKREMLIISRGTEINEGKLLRIEWHGGGMEGELIYRFEPEGGDARIMQIQTIRLKGAVVLAAPFIYTVFRSKIRKRMRGLKGLMESTEWPDDVKSLS